MNFSQILNFGLRVFLHFHCKIRFHFAIFASQIFLINLFNYSLVQSSFCFYFFVQEICHQIINFHHLLLLHFHPHLLIRSLHHLGIRALLFLNIFKETPTSNHSETAHHQLAILEIIPNDLELNFSAQVKTLFTCENQRLNFPKTWLLFFKDTA